jgi:hypothetical protein
MSWSLVKEWDSFTFAELTNLLSLQEKSEMRTHTYTKGMCVVK